MVHVSEHSGIDFLAEVTTLLQRARSEHPTKGVWEAADVQWWWRSPRSTDDQPKPFWYDDHGPMAAAVVTQWSAGPGLDLIVLPSVAEALISTVFDRGLRLESGSEAVEMLVDDDDELLVGLLGDAGFVKGDGDTTGWVDADAVPEVSGLADGYTLHTRASRPEGDHHYITRSGPDVESRLRQTSLYRPDLDLFVVDDGGEVAAYGLFWHDPVTGVGLVEPMRTEDVHQSRGLARHILTAGMNALVRAGSERVKISWDPSNSPAAQLYLSAGFAPTMTCSAWSSENGGSG